MSNFMLYYGSPIECVFDAKAPRKATGLDKLLGAKNFLLSYMQLSIVLSIMGLYFEKTAPYPDPEKIYEGGFLQSCLSRERLITNFLFAYYFQCSLNACTDGLASCVEIVTGCKTIDVMKNPLLEATSPSDFWGRRWNLLVHGVLKRGCFKPVYSHVKQFKSVGKLIAGMATFLASGLLHEWVLHIIYSTNQQGLVPGYGNNTAFFLWNGGLVCLESLFGGLAIFSVLSKSLPRPLISLLVVMTALPVAHWFALDYAKINFVNHAQVGFPLIVRL